MLQPTAGPSIRTVAQPSDRTAELQLSQASSHFLQFGAFSARANAETASTQLRRQLDWLQVPIGIEPYGGLFRVQAGPFAVREMAARAGLEVRARTGLRPFLLPRPTD
jgi:rare lipoprotein A